MRNILLVFVNYYFVTDKVNTYKTSSGSAIPHFAENLTQNAIDLNVKLQWIRLSKENKEDLWDLELGNEFLAMIPKALSIK